MKGFERLVDVRPAERLPVAAGFTSLLLIVIAHTTLETVRDALFLRYVGPSGLGRMYILAALVTLAMGSIASRIAARFGARRALVTTQLASSAAAAFFWFLPPTAATLTALYAFAAVAVSLLVPQLWTFVGVLFHAGQSRRVFGTIALAGVLGAVVGSALSAALLLVVRVEHLLFLASFAFVGSAAAIAMAPRAPLSRTPEVEPTPTHAMTVFREEPLVPRLALVAVLGAFTTLLIDYAFKAAVTARIDPANLGSFFARYYTVMNVLSLLAQLFLAQRALARAGVLGTAGALPSFLWLGGLVTVLTGGSFLAVLGTKVADAALRHSVHRTGTELVYLALPASARNRAKPLVDGAVVRLSQALAAGLLLLLARVGWDTVPRIALVATGTAFAWGVATYALRIPYLALFRRTLFGADTTREGEELDLASVELLVETLASPRPHDVVAAMDALERRSGGRLIPAIVLLYDDPDILERALDIFGGSTRRDWIHLAERHVADPRERVRRAALRALARARIQSTADRTSAKSAEELAEERPWIRAYLAASGNDLVAREALMRQIVGRDADASDARSGALAALADDPPTDAGDILVALLDAMPDTAPRQAIDLGARTAQRVGDARAIPWLISRLVHAEGRVAVRRALASLGDAACDKLVAKLRNPEVPRRLRAQIPLALGRFDRQDAADALFELLQNDVDGFVRYKCLRGLGQLVARGSAKVSSQRLRELARRELVEHFRLLACVSALSTIPLRPFADEDETAVVSLLRALLVEKRDHSLERVFRLLKMAFPDEDLHGLHTAIVSGTAAERSTAIEFLDALLAPRRRQRDLEDARPLLRLVGADLSDVEAARRASAIAGVPLPTPSTVIDVLLADRDATVAAFATAAATALLVPRPETTRPPPPLTGRDPQGAHG